jgi:hypothetical protein
MCLLAISNQRAGALTQRHAYLVGITVRSAALALIDRMGKASASFCSLGDPLLDTSSAQGPPSPVSNPRGRETFWIALVAAPIAVWVY